MSLITLPYIQKRVEQLLDSMATQGIALSKHGG